MIFIGFDRDDIMIKAIQIQDYDTDAMFEHLHNAGFKYVAVGFGSSKDLFDGDWEKRIEEIKGLMNKYSLECIQTHLPYYDLRISSEIIDDKMEDAIKKCIKATNMLGAKWTAMHPRSSYDHNFSHSRAMTDNCKCLDEYLQVCEDTGVGIALENLPIFPGASGWHFFSSHFEDICEIVDKYNSEYLGICWDTGHAHLTRLDQAQALEYIGKRLKITHVHSNYDDNDNHTIPTLGTIKWESIMPAFKKIGYEGPLTLELEYKIDPTIESYMKYCYDSVSYLDSLAR